MTTRPTCHGCGVTLRSARQWICANCVSTAERTFARDYPYTDPDSHIRNRNRFFGDMATFLAAIKSEMATA